MFFKTLISFFSITVAVAIINPLSAAAPTSPTYSTTAQDSRTGDNEFAGTDGRRWYVSDGADRYQNEIYERPTIQSYQYDSGLFSTTEYYQNLDIIEGKFGYDNTFIYALINMYGTDKSDQGGDTFEGMIYTYSMRFSNDPNGRDGYLFSSTQTLTKNGTTYGLDSNFGYKDTNSDVGGAGFVNGHPPSGIDVTKDDNFWEEVGLNGYDQEIVSDGRLISNDQDVFYSRVNPLDPSIVELAVDYVALGLTTEYVQSLEYLDLEASKSQIDKGNYFFNDKYTLSEAGSPYDLPGISTGGLGNISELDTVRLEQVPIPEPSTYLLMSLVIVALGLSYMKRRKVNP